MVQRITVVLEYQNDADAPRIGFNSEPADLGNARIVGVQFSDALAEIAVLVEDASEETQARAYIAAINGGEPVTGSTVTADAKP